MSDLIQQLKQKMGGEVFISAHHYQRKEIVDIADSVGDSYKLALACQASSADFIVFCGVRFMAESAAILARPGQHVLLPAMNAGCPMADMAEYAPLEALYSHLSRQLPQSPVPVCYMNSSADLKAFTGNHEGSICTSSNSRVVVDHFLKQGRSVLFLPDRNLGINTARHLGLTAAEWQIVDRQFAAGAETAVHAVKMFIWDGFCYVHKRFAEDDIDRLRGQYPTIRIMVHPECDPLVVEKADENGSTELILKKVAASAPGTIWGIGTESTFVRRLSDSYPEKTILPLADSPCEDMRKTDLDILLPVLENIRDRRLDQLPVIRVEEELKLPASQALDRMIRIHEGSRRHDH